MRVTSSRRDLKTVAVSFASSALLHTQLADQFNPFSQHAQRTTHLSSSLPSPSREASPPSRELAATPPPSPPTILLRLTDLDPDAKPLRPLVVTRALWHGVWLYYASGLDSPKEYRIELPLPSPVLHLALLALGATHVSPHYTLSRSAVFQLYKYASPLPVQIPFPLVSSSTNVSLPLSSSESSEFESVIVSHPLRAAKAAPGTVIYSRHIPHLSVASSSTYYALHLLSQPAHVNLLHKWLNDPRIAEQFWEQKGTWEEHEKFVVERIKDRHVLGLVGSYLEVRKEEAEHGGEDVRPAEGDPGEREANYSEVYWVREDRLGVMMTRRGEGVRNWDRGEFGLGFWGGVGERCVGARGQGRGVFGALADLVRYSFLTPQVSICSLDRIGSGVLIE